MKQIFIFFITISACIAIVSPGCKCKKTVVQAVPKEDPFAPKTMLLDVNGIKVLFKKTSSQIVSAQAFLYGNGGYTKANEGIEKLAITWSLLSMGAEDVKKFQEMKLQNGLKLYDSCTSNYSCWGLSVVNEGFSDAMSLLGQTVTKPSLSSENFGKAKASIIQQINSNKNNEKLVLHQRLSHQLFEGNTNELNPRGTETIVNLLTEEEVINYLKNRTTKSNLFIVVVGNLSEVQVRDAIANNFIELQTGVTSKPDSTLLKMVKSNINYYDDAVKDNHLYGVIGMPDNTSRNYYAMRLALEILNQKIKTAAAANGNLMFDMQFDNHLGPVPYSSYYIKTNSPNEAAQLFYGEIKKLKINGFDNEELKDIRAQLITKFYYGIKSNAQQGFALAEAYVAGNWPLGEILPYKFNSISQPEVIKAFEDYMKAIQWGFLGNKERVDEAILLMDLN